VTRNEKDFEVKDFPTRMPSKTDVDYRKRYSTLDLHDKTI